MINLSYPRFTGLYKVHGTKSFRLASSKLFGFGSNLQNLAKSVAEILIPDEGMSLVKMDQAGAEARVVAYCCLPGPYRELFEHGVKCHSFVAMHLFKDRFKPSKEALEASPKKLSQMEEWTNHLAKRIAGSGKPYDIGKMVSHASNYGIAGTEFAINCLDKSRGTLVISNREAQLFIDTYLDLFPEIAKWQAETINRVKTERVLRNLFGYPRQFNQTLSESYFKEALSFIPQSTVGVLNNRVFADMQDYIDGAQRQWILLQNLHDSIMMECPHRETEEAYEKLEQMYKNYKFPARGGGEWTMEIERA